MAMVFLGIDLAKNVFALHGVDAAGRACLVRPSVRRDQLLGMFTPTPAPAHPPASDPDTDGSAPSARRPARASSPGEVQ